MVQKTITCSALGKKYSKVQQFWVNFKGIFFPYYIVWLWMLFLVILYLLEHFKVKMFVVSNKGLGSAFL
jgi:hypothetical protein